jgi:tetratricopeptide (TPR) repeat protein
MRRTILAGALVLASGISQLLAQQPAPAAQPAPAGTPKGPTFKSEPERLAVVAIFQAQQTGPDAVIKAAEELLTKFADTEFKEIALFSEAQAYKQKNDNPKAQIFAERVLEVNPKNFQATLLVGEILASTTRENDLDREDKLTRAEKYLNDTIETLKTTPKPNPQLPDEQWNEAKKFMAAEAHNDIGLAELTRKKYDLAIKEFQSAMDLDPQPAYGVRLASAFQSAGKNDEAIALCDKILADPQLHPAIKQVATNVKAAATQAKAKAPTKQ